MTTLIHLHPALCGIAAYWLFSAFVGGMPPITATSSPGYQWLFNGLHILAGNVTAAVQTKFPEIPAGALVTQQTATKMTVQTPPP